ncbi:MULTISPECIES: flagellar basal body L-ring protein FlgH [Legionella]|uniref:Flagellar basal body L-ring protein n=1 Tax=Legionella drozanskii LLAP-1 TaxID=1212489 RepID=A0A0W0SWN6_9GAMM|nr:MULTISPECIES: flagellar basal body L-ring protein FlgH [Legionella]KTC87775.1 flagellar basal body L-ring protein [Legionella drozanskii LLAP-1]PJE10978.1 MAG: hypothetical protein CK430_09275 [Legionella sp.]
MKFVANASFLILFLSRLFFFLLFYLLIPSLANATSLFDETSYRSLIADRKAYLPGDLLTVIVMENSNAHSSADLASGKEIKAALKANYNKERHEVGFELNGKGRSAAKTGRNGKIKAALTVRVKEVQPGGSYLIEGHQLIRINGEEQTILLSGVVRTEDISAQNTVLSTRLANAAITYTGNGSVSDSQRRNYVYKVLSLIGVV